MVLFLQTAHLDLVAASLLHVDAELAGPKQLAGLLGVVVPKGWPPTGVERAFMEQVRQRLAGDGQAGIGWYGWYAICRHTALQPSTLVGVGGFFGPPDDTGTVELGFSVLPAFRGRGHATEMVRTLAAHALSQPAVERIVADSLVRDRPTQAVLLRNGFRIVPAQEPGLVRCERRRGSEGPAAADDEPTDDGAAADDDA
jgi:ribosomal-protein-alanine N-acetyltransferase